MHDLEGLFCKSVNSWIIGQIRSGRKKTTWAESGSTGLLTLGLRRRWASGLRAKQRRPRAASGARPGWRWTGQRGAGCSFPSRTETSGRGRSRARRRQRGLGEAAGPRDLGGGEDRERRRWPGLDGSGRRLDLAVIGAPGRPGCSCPTEKTGRAGEVREIGRRGRMKERARRGSSARAPIQNGQGGRGGLDRGEASGWWGEIERIFLDRGFDAGRWGWIPRGND